MIPSGPKVDKNIVVFFIARDSPIDSENKLS